MSCRYTALIAISASLANVTASASDAPTTKAANKLSNTALYSNTDDPAMCAKRYHARLGSEVLSKARATLATADAMRAPTAGMPGHWLFWDGSGVMARSARQQRLLATQQINIRDNRMCVRSILARGGRIRCLKWKPIPEGYVPPKPVLPTVDPTNPEISPAERRIASRISSLVSRKGAFAELQHGTAFYHMAQRTSDELIAYARQPYRATICSGANEMINFYRHQLTPLFHKAARSRQFRDDTHHAALVTANFSLKKNTNKIPNFGNISYSDIVRKLVRPVLSHEEYASLNINDQPMVLLRQVRELISDQRFDNITTGKRHLLRKALRNVEFVHYLRYSSGRWKRFGDSFETAFRAIRAAHLAECTCTN